MTPVFIRIAGKEKFDHVRSLLSQKHSAEKSQASHSSVFCIAHEKYKIPTGDGWSGKAGLLQIN